MSCYASARSSHCCTHTHTSCYASARSSHCCTHTHTSCYASARSSHCCTHTHVMLRFCTFFSLLQRHCVSPQRRHWQLVETDERFSHQQCPHNQGVDEGELQNMLLYSILPMAMGNPTWLAENNSKVYQATVLTLKAQGPQKRKHVLMHVAAKVKPSLSETPFLTPKLTFRTENADDENSAGMF